jgi:hypothetical protein
MAVLIRPSLFWIPASMPSLRLGETIFPAHIEMGTLSRVHRMLLQGWRRRLAQSNEARARVSGELAARLSLNLPCGAAHPYLRLPVLATSSDERTRWLRTSRARGLGLARASLVGVGESRARRRDRSRRSRAARGGPSGDGAHASVGDK